MDQMLKVAGEMAKSEAEPDRKSAKIIREAVERAQVAFINEDMDRVMELLTEGLLEPADSTRT